MIETIVAPLTWLLHQLYLTGVEIKREITIPHTVTAILSYGIVHAVFYLIKQEMTLLNHLKDARDKYAWLHIKKRHKGRFSHCDDCKSTQGQYQVEATDYYQQQ